MQENNFNKNYLENELLNKLMDENKNFTTSRILEHMINMLIKAEKKIYLQENENDKGNGYYDRKLGTPVGALYLLLTNRL